MMNCMTTTLATGATYLITYKPTIYGKPVTKRLTVTETFETGAPHPVTGKRAITHIFHGARGGKVVLTPAEILKAEEVA